MSDNEKLTYKDAGVDTKEGGLAVTLMKEHVKKTFNSNVLTGLGSFGSLYRPDFNDMSEPILVAGTDGVGTKLKVAFLMDKHDTVGQDCVAMCVNDIICQGASPMFFLDYIATGKVEAEKIANIVKGIADACLLSECALVGGETAEMPSFYQVGEYDMAGFAVGIVDRKKIIDGSKVKKGDVIIGIPSNGIHSNGYSLVRKIFFDKLDMPINEYIDDIGMTLGEALLTPTRIYVKSCKAIFRKYDVNGIVHITGGGFYENIPRIIPKGLGVDINLGTWNILSIFKYIQKCGNIDYKEMFSTFNMGIGMMLVVDEKIASGVMSVLIANGENPSIIGRITDREGIHILNDNGTEL